MKDSPDCYFLEQLANRYIFPGQDSLQVILQALHINQRGEGVSVVASSYCSSQHYFHDLHAWIQCHDHVVCQPVVYVVFFKLRFVEEARVANCQVGVLNLLCSLPQLCNDMQL